MSCQNILYLLHFPLNFNRETKKKKINFLFPDDKNDSIGIQTLEYNF